MPGTILAVDPSTMLGVAVGPSGGTPVLSTVKLRLDAGDDHVDVFKRAGRWLWELVARDPPDVLAIEMPLPPMLSRNFVSTRIGLGLDGLFTGIAGAAGVRIVHAPIGEWRKCVLGHGRMKGADAKRAMLTRCRQLGWDAPDHNAAEAAGIWLWACSHTSAAKGLFGRFR